jgi:hypothetical protein
VTRAKILALLLAIPVLASACWGRKADWRAVQHLPAGTRLKIKLKHGHTFGHCDFLGATGDALTCDYAGFLQDTHPRYPRDNIKAVYLVHNARAIGFGIGAGAGTILGATVAHGSLVNHELFAVLNAGILGGVGYCFGMLLDPFFHGNAVYVDSNPRRVRSSPPAPDPR